jgi:hypothetical protein
MVKTMKYKNKTKHKNKYKYKTKSNTKSKSIKNNSKFKNLKGGGNKIVTETIYEEPVPLRGPIYEEPVPLRGPIYEEPVPLRGPNYYSGDSGYYEKSVPVPVNEVNEENYNQSKNNSLLPYYKKQLNIARNKKNNKNILHWENKINKLEQKPNQKKKINNNNNNELGPIFNLTKPFYNAQQQKKNEILSKRPPLPLPRGSSNQPPNLGRPPMQLPRKK